MIKISEKLKSFVRPSPHSTFSPSGADQWIACPASINLGKAIPEGPTSSYAAEGTMAHSLCEYIIMQSWFGTDIPIDMQMQLVTLEDKGAEMIECAESYADVVNAWIRHEHLGEILWHGLEKGIPIFPEDGCFGTADYVAIGTKGAVIIDFKYGKGKEVKAGSTQLLTYALGLFNNLENIPEDYEWHTVVYQPRISPVPKHAEYTNAQMQEHYQVVRKAINESRVEGITPIEGNHCFWCKARRTKDPALKCPAIKQKAIDLANENFDKFFKDMNTPANTGEGKRDAALIKLMSLYPLIKSVVEDAEAEFELRISRGEPIDGVDLLKVTGRKKWCLSDIDEMEALLKKSFSNLDNITHEKKCLASITEIKKKLNKDEKKKLESLLVQPISSKIVIRDDKMRSVLESMSTYALSQGVIS